MIKLINGDCLQELKKIEDNSVNLVLIDPPYNIGKDTWDKWKTVELYVEFLEEVFLELQRVLKDNGSFYFFHNDFMQIVEIQNMINKKTDFVFKQFIVWDKYNGSKWNQLNAIVHNKDNRNFSKQAEYCLFYTFQDETGRKKVDYDINNYKTLRDYSRKTQEYINLKTKQITNIIGRKVEHFFYHSSTQFSLPTKQTYIELTETFNLRNMEGFKEYEELRYTFNNQNLPSVLQHEPIKQNGHLTPKPISILEKLILTSSNEGDVVLDCFMGSGSTGVSCKNLNRDFIGIEIDEEYFKISEERINKK